MAAPVASKILLPDDTSNTGKKVRTQTRVVGADTVHEHFYVPEMEFEVVSRFWYSSTNLSVSATVQDGTATGFLWLQNPAASTITAVLRRIAVKENASAVLVMPTGPVIDFTKFTFTGTASGASVTPLPARTGAAANQMIVRTALTGMTITKVASLGAFHIPCVETAVGSHGASFEVLPFNPYGFQRGQSIEIAPGEGLVVWQSVAGTASDNRRFGVQIEWDEVDLT